MVSFPILDRLQDSYEPPLTPETLEELEIELGVRFPRDYADFLLQFNGGTFHHPVMFYLPNPIRGDDAVSMTSFLGEMSNRLRGQDLVGSARRLDDRIPKDFLVIAHCTMHLDYVLLKLVGPKAEFEGVWFWDYDGFSMPEDGPNIHWIADSFNDFLSMLMPDLEENEERETVPLFQQVERGNLRAIQQYLSDGGGADIRNDEGQTLLAAAATYSWPKIVRLLLEHSADPNARDNQGRTPLHHAATHSVDSIKLLLKAGADAKVRDRDGKSVLGEWSYDLDQILRAHGAEE